MSNDKKQFQIHLPGLLKVLAESLYSTQKVGIRELIQNAHDSCIRRRTEGKDRNFQPRIDISFDLVNRKIIVQDNGSGLTETEVTEYLSTIGRSYTRQLGEDLAFLSPDEASKLVGQFGLGFLSAFLIAEEVTLTTRSYKEGHPTLLWRSAGDVHYDVTLVETAQVGTRVELQVKPEASFLLNERVMIDTVRMYADFLDIPVYVSNSRNPINATVTPWEGQESELAMREYIDRTFGHPDVLAIIPLKDQEISLGYDSVTIPMRGFLFVPRGSLASVQEYGDMNVYIRRMFICERYPHLLPSWAKFVRGVIDCPYLQPTASREDLQQDDMFRKTQQALATQLSQALQDIAKNDPPTWKKIVYGHRSLMMWWALKDDAFFDAVAEHVTFSTPQGQKTLSEYLQETDDTVYYVTREIGSKQDQLLGEGYGVPVIDASWAAENHFLQKYAHRHRNIKLVEMDGEANQLLQAVPEEAYRALLDYYRKQRIKARVVAFKPEDVPAIINYPKDAEFIRETRDALDKGDIPTGFAGLVGDYVSKMNVSEEMLAGTLSLNANSLLIQELAKLAAGQPRDAALELIYQMARLFSGRMLDSKDITHAFRMSAASLQHLIKKDD